MDVILTITLDYVWSLFLLFKISYKTNHEIKKNNMKIHA